MNASAAASESFEFDRLRRTMIDRQIRPFDVTDLELVARFLDIPRHLFVQPGQEAVAYSDFEVRLPLADGGRRSMLTPLVAARLLQAAEIGPQDHVLTVGAGTGYVAALIAGLAAGTTALESDADLASRAGILLAKWAPGVKLVAGPLRAGAPAQAPFDVIVVEGAAQEGLETLVAQLKPEGRLLAFRAQAGGASRAILMEKAGGAVAVRDLFEGAARPLADFDSRPAFQF